MKRSLLQTMKNKNIRVHLMKYKVNKKVKNHYKRKIFNFKKIILKINSSRK